MIESPKISSWNSFPTEEDPSLRYKFTSAEVNFSPDLKTIYRQTYSALDWLGDIGGLTDALMIIIGALTLPVATFALKAKLLSYLFRFRESEKKPGSLNEANKKLHQQMKNSLIGKLFDDEDYDE